MSQFFNDRPRTKRAGVCVKASGNASATGIKKMALDNNVQLDNHINPELFKMSIYGSLDILRSHVGRDVTISLHADPVGNTPIRGVGKSYSLNESGRKKLVDLLKKRGKVC